MEGLDMTLDDIIKKNQKSKADKGGYGGRGRGGRFSGSDHVGGGGGRGQGYGPWPNRSFSDRGHSSRLMPYSTEPWLHMREKGMIGGGPSYENAGAALHVSNLSLDVTHADIKVLFSDVGDLKRYTIHYDGSGRPKGTAEVVFERHSDALAAIRRYNNRILDGMRMNIVLIGSDVTSPKPSASHDMENQTGSYGRGNRIRLAQGHSQKRGKREKVSAEALDADLEKYHEDATRTM